MFRRGLWPLRSPQLHPHCCCSSQGWVEQAQSCEGRESRKEAEQVSPVPMPGLGSARTTAEQVWEPRCWAGSFPFLGSVTAFLSPDGMHEFLVEVGNGKAQARGLGSNALPSASGPCRSCVSLHVIYYSFCVLVTPLCKTCRTVWKTRRRNET